MNQVFIAISLWVLYCYPSLNIVEEKNVKKIFRQKVYFDYVLLNLFLDSSNIVHEHVSRGAEPESEL